MCDATYRTGLHDNCGLKNFQRAVSTGHEHSTLNKTGFENQYVLDEKKFWMKERVGGWRRLSCRERPLLAGNNLQQSHNQYRQQNSLFILCYNLINLKKD